MNWGDWQFWLVTLAALWGLWAVVRQLLPEKGQEEPACKHCSLANEMRDAARKNPPVTENPKG